MSKTFMCNAFGTMWMIVAFAGYMYDKPEAAAIGGGLALFFFLICPPYKPSTKE